jgi:hypothetical protein
LNPAAFSAATACHIGIPITFGGLPVGQITD